MMQLTILIDLDGTLLSNNINSFIPVYLNTLSNELLPGSPGIVEREIMAATGKMIANKNPAMTLEDVFDRNFYPAIGKSKQELSQLVHHFYTRKFPSLRHLTSPSEGAKLFIEKVSHRKCLISVATNPVFPQTATRQRLHWAELPVKEERFSIISSYEKFHFTKPSPAFYAELMGQLGWPTGPTIMVGDDYEMDIKPASQLCIPAYWVNNQPSVTTNGAETLLSGGSFFELPEWISKNLNKDDKNLDYGRDGVVAVLRSTPAVIDTLRREHPLDDWIIDNKPGGIRPFDILIRMLSPDLTTDLMHISHYLTGTPSTLPEPYSGNLHEGMITQSINPERIISDFISFRETFVKDLENYPEPDWKRTIDLPDGNSTTLLYSCNQIAKRDKHHLHQLYGLFQAKMSNIQ